MIETISGRALSFIPVPILVGREGSARLCTNDHIRVWIDGMPERTMPLHVDITMKLWGKNVRTSVRAIQVSAAGQDLVDGMHSSFEPITLEAGDAPIESGLQYEAPSGEELRARPGDVVVVKLILTRGRSRKLKLKLPDVES